MDQPEVLRTLPASIHEGTIDSCRRGRRRNFACRHRAGARRTVHSATIGDPTHSGFTLIVRGKSTEPIEFNDVTYRRDLHVRCTHKKRIAVQPTRSWASTLLATQRHAGDAATREVEDQ